MAYRLPASYREQNIPGVSGAFFLHESRCGAFMAALTESPSLYPKTAGARGAVAEIQAGTDMFMVRRYRHGGLAGKFTGSIHFNEQRAVQEVFVCEAAAEHGIPVPEIIGFRVVPNGPFKSLELISRKVENAVSVEKFLAESSAAERRHLSSSLADLVGRVHSAGLMHADFHIRNILVRNDSSEDRLVILDWDRAKVVDSLSEEAASLMLFRLNRSLEKFGVPTECFTKSDRMRFLKQYLTNNGHADSLRSWAAGCEKHLARHRLWWRLCGR